MYGNDDSVYINVELKNVVVDDNSNGGASRQIIDDVESITTGVKNANLVMENLVANNGFRAPAAEIYTLYNDDGYVIAAVTIGENDGASSSYAYITSSQPNREAYDANADEYTWTREAVVNGEIVELREVGDTLEYLSRANMKQGEWYEVKYDADGNVRKVEDINFAASNDSADASKFISEVLDVQRSVNANDTVLLADLGDHANNNYDITALTFKNGTLYTDTNATLGFSVSPDVKVVLALADKTGTSEFDEVSDGYTGYNGLEKALRDLNANSAGFTAGTVEVSAVLESGVATSIVINDKNAKGSDIIVTPGPSSEMGVTVDVKNRYVVANFLDGTTPQQQSNAIRNALLNAGVDVARVDVRSGYAVDTDGYYYDLYISTFWSLTVDNEVVDYAPVSSGKLQNGKYTVTCDANSTNYKQTIGNDPATYPAKATTISTLTNHTVIESDYVKVPTVSYSGTATAATTTPAKDSYVRLGSEIKVDVTATADDVITITVTNGTAPATVTADASGKATFTVTNITGTPTIAVAGAAAPATYTVSSTGLAGTFSGLTVSVVDADTSATDGSNVQITLSISGTIMSDATLTAADTGSTNAIAWNNATLPNGMSAAGADLTVKAGEYANAEVVLMVTVNENSTLSLS